MNICVLSRNIVFFHAHEDLYRGLDVLQHGEAVEGDEFVVLGLKVLVFEAVELLCCSDFDLQV